MASPLVLKSSMHLLGGLVILSAISAISAVSITASDLPECAVECYCLTAEKEAIPVTDYEGQCRSPSFQRTLRGCAKKECSEEEYEFTEYHAKEYCSQFGVDIGSVVKKRDLSSQAEGEVGPEGDPSENGDLDISQTSSPPLVKGTCTRCNHVAEATTLSTETASATVSATSSAATASAVATTTTATASPTVLAEKNSANRSNGSLFAAAVVLMSFAFGIYA